MSDDIDEFITNFDLIKSEANWNVEALAKQYDCSFENHGDSVHFKKNGDMVIGFSLDAFCDALVNKFSGDFIAEIEKRLQEKLLNN